MRAVHAECLGQLPSLLRGPNAAARFERVAAVLTRDAQLRFPDARLEIARALFRAWTEERQSPGADAQAVVRDFALTHIGHPQLRLRAWIGADPEAAILRRWLAQASLRVFFGLIADHARNSQWPYREAFWSACLTKGAIADAWLVLGRSVYADAHARKELGFPFGKLAKGSPEHSVLLLRVGPLILAEWSHDGKLRAWRVEDGPKLFLPTYARDDIQRPAPFELVHSGSATDLWQSRAAELLERYAEVRLHQSEWQIQ